MEPKLVKDDALVKLLDSMAIVMHQSEPGPYGSGWMNLRQNTDLDVSKYTDFEEAKSYVVTDLKEKISRRIITIHRQEFDYQIQNRTYRVFGDVLNPPDGKYYKMGFLVEVDERNRITLITADFDLSSTYIDSFREESLPLQLN